MAALHQYARFFASFLLPLTIAASETGASELVQNWRWTRFSIEQGLPSNDIQDVAEVAGTPWALTSSGLAWYDGYLWRPVDVPGASSQMTLMSTGSSVVLMGQRSVFTGSRDGFREVAIPLQADESVESINSASDARAFF